MNPASPAVTRHERKVLELVRPSADGEAVRPHTRPSADGEAVRPHTRPSAGSGDPFTQRPGAIIGRRYRLDRLLAESGMARVWAATHTITERQVAIKIPLEWMPPELRAQILCEARTTSAVDHPSVVQIYDAFELDDGTPIMIMELLKGETLGALLARKGTLPLRGASRILMPIVSAVVKAHALGIIHRDLKPDNVFLAETEGRTTVKLLDFGIAKTLSNAKDPTVPMNELMVGTPRYMSPEQLFGEAGLDHRVDIWAIGAMLYEVLTGRWPVEGDNIGEITERLLVHVIPPIGAVGPELPFDVQLLVDGMLVRDRARRLADLREAQYVLSSHCEIEPTCSGERRSNGSSKVWSRARGAEAHRYAGARCERVVPVL